MANERFAEFIEETPKTWLQGLYEESSTAKHRLGQLRSLADGRVFVYCKMGATNGVQGVVYQSAASDPTNLANLAVTAVANVGDREIAFTLGDSNAANSLNALAEAAAYVNVGLGAGQCFKIKNHAAIAANANGTIYLYDKLRANLSNANSKISFLPHPCTGLIICPSPATAKLIGVPTGPVTANYYAWLQKKGQCTLLADGTLVAGNNVINAQGSVNGAGIPADTNGNDAPDQQIGTVLQYTANGHYCLVDLDL